MRIVLHDYAGHPFQIELSRKLALQGHEVHHIYFASDVTPRGALAPRADDPPTLTIQGIDIDGPYKKFSYWQRLRYERAYGKNAADYINKVAPDILICANVPVDALAIIRRRCRAEGRQFIIWLQDVLSVGIRHVLERKLGAIGTAIGWRYMALERANLKSADKIVCITQDFVPFLARWGIPTQRCEVIENWAPLHELMPFKDKSSWPAEQGLDGKRLIIYSGTLGLKHNPALLLAAASKLRDRPDHRLVVISEGTGAGWLKDQLQKHDVPNLVLLPFQPYARLAEILSLAEIVIGVLEPEAGIFSVPSKILSYLCVGRPVLLAAPAENLASRIVTRAEAGKVVSPSDLDGFARTLLAMVDAPEETAAMGQNARRYAETHFAIDPIARRFEALWQPERPALNRRVRAEHVAELSD